MSAFASCNEIAITQGAFRFPLQGAWEASFTVSSDDALAVTGRVTIDLGGTELHGFATADADRGNLVTVRVVGGAGGLGAACPARPYIGTTRGTLLIDALSAGGETLSPTSSAAATGAPVQRWTRVLSTVGGAVRSILEPTGLTWRVLPDGTVWVGEETWPTVEPVAKVESEAPTEKRLTLALESVALLPGVTYAGHQVSSVVYTLDDRRLRADVSYAEGRAGVAGQLAAFVRRELATVDLMRSYEAQVVGQNADGSLELRLFDDRIPHLSKVPAKFGIPGVTSFTVPPGTRVLLDHENGDAEKPVVTSFAGDQALSIHVDAIEVKLGVPAASQFVALGPLVAAELSKIRDTLLSATCAAPGSPVVYSVPYIPGNVNASAVSAS